MEFTELVGTRLWKEASDDEKHMYQVMFESGFWALQKAIKSGEIRIVPVDDMKRGEKSPETTGRNDT